MVRMTSAVSRLVDAGRRHLLRMDVRRTAVPLLAIVVVLAVLGALNHHGAPLGLFDFDGEGKPPAAYSALMLIAAGLAALLVAEDAAEGRRLRWRVLGGFFLFMAVDEALTLHETIQNWANDAWLELYAPIILAAAIAAAACLLTLRDVLKGFWLISAGGACWFVAQVLEKLEANPEEGKVEGYWIYAMFEEALETSGSILFLLGCAVVYQTRLRRSAGAAPASDVIPGQRATTRRRRSAASS